MSALLPELLGFTPQLVLDDIINSASEATFQGVDAAEVFIGRWLEHRENSHGVDPELRKEVQAGLAAFETLLDSNGDLAFDSFEIWSLRNVFGIPPDIDIITPHHKGLDLNIPEGKEEDLLNEIDELRNKVDNMRKVHSHMRKANAQAAIRLSRSTARLEELSFLDSPSTSMPTLSSAVHSLLQKIHSLPQPPPIAAQDVNAKRPWETSRPGYVEWVVERLVNDTGVYDEGTTTQDTAKTRAIALPKALRTGLKHVDTKGDRNIEPSAPPE